MSRHAHRAERRLRRRVAADLGALGLVAAIVAGIALVVSGNAGFRGGSGGSAAGDLAGAAAANITGPGFRGATPRQVDLRYAERAARLAAKKEEAQRLARKAARRARLELLNAPFEFRIGTFNVLGSQHTAPGGDRKRFPPASVRSVAAANLMAKHGVDIVGTQELQPDQLAALQSRTGMAAYPGLSWGSGESDNSILYDSDQFTVVSGSRFTITFMGHLHPQPIVRFQEIATGREFYVVNTHPSAGGGRYLAERRRGQAALVGVVNDLKQTGLPVFVTGDMNDRQEFYCRVVPPAGLIASNGGSYSSGCRPPPGSIPVDWVVGAGDLTWTGYWRDTSPVTNRTSDHFFISATAHVG